MIEALLFLLSSGEIKPISPRLSLEIKTGIASYANPLQKKTTIKPIIKKTKKTAFAAIDIHSQKILTAHNFYRPQNIASLTKIMTTLIILQEHKLDEVVTVSPKVNKTIGAQIGLLSYEKITIKTLIEALLIPSANDAAKALAIFNAGSEKAFVKKMNQYAKKWGLQSAVFYNASGLDIETDNKAYGNTMSAYDISILARKAWKNNFIRKTVQKTEFFGTSIDESFTHKKKNTNQLLGNFLNVRGLKTGYTKLAGQCLVTVGYTPEGHEVLTVMLGSDDRFNETEKLLSWAYNGFWWK